MGAHILIFIMSMNGFNDSPATHMAVEFNNLKACQAAGKLIAQQAKQKATPIRIFACVSKN